MRTLLVTGPGGAGRTTVAAATALAAARAGRRTLVISADRTDTLGAALGAPDAHPGLTALRLTPDDRFRDDLVALQERAGSVFELLGADRLDGEELTPLPGGDELALLRALRDAAREDAHDTVVVDLPAAPKALAALALPEQLRRYLRRLLPPERQAARALRPMLGRLAGVPMPAAWLYETAARWEDELAAVQALVEAPDTTVRLVAGPGPGGADALRAATAGLALHGLRTDLVIANRILPDASADTWLAALAAQQHKTLAEWETAYDRVVRVPHLGRDPRGADELAALGVPAPDAAPGPVAWPVTEATAEDGGGRVFVWHIPLPGVVREELGLIRRGDELVVTAGPFRRIVTLPSALRRCTVAGAGLREGELRVRFTPDPDLWPRDR
ncbi:ArsA family ATPase [Streptomyces formicae]|uniref:Arsenical pump-driving ATPase n=1 Tax=Streptomyces formicae TaxID=1616117 RepID=A0A291Q5X0_9ACTN|nr:ArsA-related P-loop ATPase [Streptomyces formicae]ATL27131.1 Arsenical pump-driving ATPase [Streptomyces formicae]